MTKREPKRKLKVACILDKFSYDSLSYEIDLTFFTQEGVEEFLEERQIRFFPG